MPKFKTTIVPGGKSPPVEATVEARNAFEAKKLFEAQYGKEAVKFSATKA